MKVREFMKKDIKTCSADATLQDAARIMWEGNCGLVPVVAKDGKRVVGVLTDRDACMAAWTQGRAMSEIPVSVPMSTRLYCCNPNDTLEKVHQDMRTNLVKRLLVTDEESNLLGVVSLAALAKLASNSKSKDAQATRSSVAETLAAFAEPKAVAALV